MQQRWPYLFLSLVIFFTGCSSVCPSKSKSSEAATEACHQLHQQQALAQTLSSDGVQVVKVGDEVTLVLSADSLFYYNSNHMQKNTAVLDDVINFINAYPTVNVQVIGYPNCYGNDLRNLALSRAQAQEVAKYLDRNGLNTRLITATAMKTTHDEPRIEIFFRLPAPDNVFH